MSSGKAWSNLAKVVYKRTYAREDLGKKETWEQTIERIIAGNVNPHIGTNRIESGEVEALRKYLLARKGGPAGRGYWFSGAPAHETLGGAALVNCWGTTAENWETFVIAMDLLMLGGGVGLTVESRFVSKLPKVRKDVTVTHKDTKDADFIVPDSRSGWCELYRRVLESFFVTGKSFSYSTVCIRGAGEKIKGFGGTASGPLPLVEFVSKLVAILKVREGKYLRSIDAADLLCVTGELVVSGNVRRSAILILGEPGDKEYLVAKRWDLGQIPTYRSCANFSVVCDDVDDLHPLFWKTYEQGEPFGIVNRKVIRSFGRIGERKKDTAVVVNPCAEATLEAYEPCVGYNTELITRDGLVKIGDSVGSKIEIWNGVRWSTVYPRQTGTNRDLFRVHLSDGSFIDCTDNHKFSTKTKLDKGYSCIKLKDIKFDARYSVRLEDTTIQNISELEIKDAYTLGLAFGDGWKDNGIVFIGLYKTQTLPAVGKRYKATQKEGHNTDCVRVRTDLPIETFEALRANNFDLLFKASRDSVLKFIAGCIDTDGTATSAGTARLYVSGKDRARLFQLLLLKNGIRATVSTASLKGHVTNYGTRKQDLMYLTITDCKDIPCHRVGTSGGHKPRKKGKNLLITHVEKLDGTFNTYCFDEAERHMGVFGSVLTYQCNLQEIPLPNLDSVQEFEEVARLLHRWGKRVTLEKYHHPEIQEVIDRNRRIGTGITGCLQSGLFKADILDNVYKVVQKENQAYSGLLNIPESIRTTVVKPSGTLSKMFDCSEGIHAAYSRYFIQRIRFSSSDPLIPVLRAAGHHIEPQVRFDGSYDPSTFVVDFYVQTPEGTPVADEEWGLTKQLDTHQFAQRHWADQAVSVTVYYKREEIPKIKEWLANNFKNIKTISFLCHSEHGFKQAPKEAFTKEKYEELSLNIKPIDMDSVTGDDVDSLECASGFCPVK